MKSESVFRISILLLCFASFFLNYMTGDLEYSEDIVNTMSLHGFNSQIPHWLKLSLVGPLQVSALFMLNFNLIARNVFAAFSIAVLALSLFEGVAAYTALEIFIVQLYYLSTGVVLTLSFTNLRDQFKLSRTGKQVQTQTQK